MQSKFNLISTTLRPLSNQCNGKRLNLPGAHENSCGASRPIDATEYFQQSKNTELFLYSPELLKWYIQVVSVIQANYHFLQQNLKEDTELLPLR